MILYFQILILTLIFSIIIFSNAYRDCSLFKPDFEKDCSSLSDKTKICEYKNKLCKCRDIQCKDLDTKEKCENSYIEEHYLKFGQKCIYDTEKGCFEGYKLCSEWNPIYGKEYCILFYASKTHYECRYLNGECIENLGMCNFQAIISKDQDLKSTCESIIPLYEKYKCVYEYKNSAHYCKQVEYCTTANTKEECESIILPERLNRYNCVFKNNVCVLEQKYYDYCSQFKTGVTKELCEANIPKSSLDKCVYDSNKGCTTKSLKKHCSEWKNYFNHEKDYSYCRSLFIANKENYECRYINGECVEALGDCSDFDGTKKSCESIIPLNTEYDKCIFQVFNGKNSCFLERKLCEDDIPRYALFRCKERETKNSETICISNGEKCVEAYAKCEDYKINVDKEKCESIKPYNDLGEKICVYENNLCVSKSWYELEEQKFKTQCENIIYKENKYCSFVDDICLQPEKQCLEIKSINDELSEKICNEAIVSDSSKICILKENKKGCEEIQIPIKNTSIVVSNDINENIENNNNESNKGNIDNDENEENEKNGNEGQIYKTKFVNFIVYISLFL